MVSLNDQTAAIEMGEHIKNWRLLLQLTAKQVSERAEISTVTYSKIENGDFSVSSKALLRVFRSLGLLAKASDAIDPFQSDLGRAQMENALPKRIRS